MIACAIVRSFTMRRFTKTFAEQLEEAIPKAAGRRTLEQRPAAADDGEADLGIAERELRPNPRDLRRLRCVGLEELASRGQVVEQIRDFNACAFRRTDLAD